MELMKHAFMEACEHTLAVLPFLLIIYFILELMEHRYSHKTLDLKRYGPVIGSAVGTIPQCGFSVAATTLFNKGVITTGTLIAVYLSTSDEAIPILLAHPDQFSTVIKLILIKFLVGLIAGIVIDQFVRKPIADDCYCSDCHEGPDHAHEGVHHHHEAPLSQVLRHSIKKTLQIFLFLLVSMFFIDLAVESIGEDRLQMLLTGGTLFQPFLCAFVGLIPTCLPSILITQLFLSGTIPFGSAIAGLCAGSGMGIIILFKENGSPKTIAKVLGLLYLISAASGLILNFIF